MAKPSRLRCTVDRLPAELQPHSLTGGGNLTTAKDGMGAFLTSALAMWGPPTPTGSTRLGCHLTYTASATGPLSEHVKLPPSQQTISAQL